MTVQELFKKLNRDEFVNEYLSYCGESQSVKRKKILNGLLDSFDLIETTPNDSQIIFCLPLLGECRLDSFVVKKEDLLDVEIENGEIPEGYAYEFSCMADVLGYSVSDACLHAFGELKVACGIFYEMTFFGYNIKEQKEISEKEATQIDKSIEEIHSNEAKLISFEEICEKYGLVDKRKDFEREFDTAKIHIDNEAFAKLEQELCKLEIHYLFEKL